MNTYYNKFIQQHGEKKFMVLYTIIFAIVMIFVTYGTITIILGESIVISRLPIFFVISLCLGYVTCRNILKRQ